MAADPIPDIGARIRAVPGLPDVLADLIGLGSTFSSVEDYDRAMEWALRAYRAARLATAREIAAAANRPGSVPAASWRAAMDIIDELGGDPR